MIEEVWELQVAESRILFIYREYDAISSLMTALTGNDMFFKHLHAEQQKLMQAICQEQPACVLDLAAQSVVMAMHGLIDVPLAELQRYLGALTQYIENGGESGSNAADDKLVPFAAFWRKLAAKAESAPAVLPQQPGTYRHRRPTRIWG